MESVLYEKAGAIAMLTCGQTTGEAMNACLEALSDCQQDSHVRVLVWSYTGQSAPTMAADDGPSPTRIIQAWRALPQIVLATVDGWASGASLAAVLASDMALAAPTAAFSFGYTSHGASPGAPMIQLMRETLGRRLTAQLVLLDERLSAAQALTWDIVQRVAPADILMEEAWTLAEQFAQLCPDLRQDYKSR